MRANVPPRARFVMWAAGLTAVGYAAVLGITSQNPLWWDVGFAVPAVAMILAAQGVRLRRRLAWALGVATASVATCVVEAATGLAASSGIMASTEGFHATTMQIVAVALARSLRFVVPWGAVALFVGRRPDSLVRRARESIGGAGD